MILMKNKNVFKTVFDEKFNMNLLKKQIINKYESQKNINILKKLSYTSILIIVILIFGLYIKSNSNKPIYEMQKGNIKMYAYALANDNFLEKRQLTANTKLPLASYNKAMSNVPGFPISFEMNNIDYIEISVTNGNVYSWDKETGLVNKLDNNYKIYKNDTLYFNVNENTSIKIKAKKNDETLYEKYIVITSDENYNYYAKLNDFEINIKFNKLDNLSLTSLDSDIKDVESDNMDFPNAFDYNKLKLPNDLTKVKKSIIYTKNEKQNDYTNLNSYILNYYNDNETKNIKVSFSDKNRPIRDYYFSNENAVTSIIKDKKLKIYSYEEIFFVEFHYNNYYFDIETNNILQDELIDLISSII